jgi:hypothetical protein
MALLWFWHGVGMVLAWCWYGCGIVVVVFLVCFGIVLMMMMIMIMIMISKRVGKRLGNKFIANFLRYGSYSKRFELWELYSDVPHVWVIIFQVPRPSGNDFGMVYEGLSVWLK